MQQFSNSVKPLVEEDCIALRIKRAVFREFQSAGIDIGALRPSIERLSLRETGELMRALRMAQRARRPSREQRLLLALFGIKEGCQ